MTERSAILYARETDLALADFRRVLEECSLGAVRPVGDAERLRTMLAQADLVVTARLDQPDRRIVGMLRAVTDWSWCCYVSELAVSASAQRLGIGTGLLDEARRQLGPQVALMLASVPDAVGFYERIGMKRLPDAFWFRRER